VRKVLIFFKASCEMGKEVTIRMKKIYRCSFSVGWGEGTHNTLSFSVFYPSMEILLSYTSSSIWFR
jgi:hypothetical protein